MYQNWGPLQAYALRIRLTANEETQTLGIDPGVVAVGELTVDDVVECDEDPKMVAFEFESSGEASSSSCGNVDIIFDHPALSYQRPPYTHTRAHTHTMRRHAPCGMPCFAPVPIG